ncbi:receptor expression-enhancing protein 6 isoform X2 [Manis pentadactyla]|uniref:receptor expression-enhancing protein 6 isoform X2 n=1 Tax=Manis pentadactyla TaxID=143292 RepID=UPI00255CB749|nr:receptor expression-enhancing protein 6 isoform X2 [Manis pentadactyla]
MLRAAVPSAQRAPRRPREGGPALCSAAPSSRRTCGGASRAGPASGVKATATALRAGRSCHPAKPVSSVWLRGASAVQSHWLCVPSICFHQSHREPNQRRRHCVAHLLGGVRPVRGGRVLQRPTTLLVSFLLRGQVCLPAVLHGSLALERGSHAVSSCHSPAVSKASRGRGQRREQPQRASAGHGSRNNQGCQNQHDSAPEGQVRHPPSSHTDLLAGTLGDMAQPKPSADSATDSPANPSTSPSSPSKSGCGSPSRATVGQFQAHPMATSSATIFKLPSKSRSPPQSPANSSGQPHAPSQQLPHTSNTSLGPSHQSSGSMQRTSTSSSQEPPPRQPPSHTHSPRGTPDGPGNGVPQTSTSSPPQQPSSAQPASSPTVPELPVSCQSDSSVEDYTLETPTEVTHSWPYHHGLRCLQHCWRLKHLAC